MKTNRELIAEMDATRVGDGECAFWWLGQHGFAIKLGDTMVYVDAFLSPLEGRRVAPLLAPEEVANARLILGTHDHIDHIDRPAWPGMAAASPEAVFVVPRCVETAVAAELGIASERVLGVDDGETVEHGGVRVTGLPAAHEFLDRDPASGLHPYLGYFIEGNGVRLYHAGDTCLYEGVYERLRRQPIDIAFLPINGRDAKRLAAGCIGNMTYQEAADLAGAISSEMVVPTHFEMFAMNSEDPNLFIDYMAVKYPGIQTYLPEHGQRFLYRAES